MFNWLFPEGIVAIPRFKLYRTKQFKILLGSREVSPGSTFAVNFFMSLGLGSDLFKKQGFIWVYISEQHPLFLKELNIDILGLISVLPFKALSHINKLIDIIFAFLQHLNIMRLLNYIGK